MHHSSWKLVDVAATRMHWLGDDAVVFNPRTWHTHLVDGAAGEVLEALRHSPLTLEGLAERLGVEATGIEAAALTRILNELRAVDLVERCADEP